MKSPVDEIALQGIEFWSTVCNEEMDLGIEAVEAKEQGRPPEQASKFYVKGAQEYLIPVLLSTLTKQVGVALVVSCDGHVTCRRTLTMKMTGILVKLRGCVLILWLPVVKMI